MTAFRPRVIRTLLNEALATMRVVVVTGLRQTGKSTPLQQSPRCRVAILAHTGTATVPLGERLWAMPIAALLN